MPAASKSSRKPIAVPITTSSNQGCHRFTLSTAWESLEGVKLNAGWYNTSPAFTHGEVYSAAGRYDGAIGDLGVTVAAGFLRVNDKASSALAGTLQSAAKDTYDLSLVLYWGNWGSWWFVPECHRLAKRCRNRYRTFNLGLAYWSDGAWSAGIYWLHQEIDYAAGDLVLGANITDEFDAYRLMGQYDLGPGIAVTGAIGLDTFDDGVVNQTYDTQMIGTGISIGF